MGNETYQDVKDELINKLLGVLWIAIILPIASSVVRFVQTGWQSSYALHIIILPTILLVAYYRESISLFIKTTILVLICVLIAAFDFYDFGLYGASGQYLMLAVLFSIVFGGKRMALWTYAFSVVTIAGFAILTVTEVVAPTSSTSNYNTFILSWANALVSFLLVLGLVILIVGNIGRLLNSKLLELKRTNDQLQQALSEVKTLRGLLTICSFCKKIRDDKGNWQNVEIYVKDRSDATFSHGFCPECAKVHYPDVFR